MLIGQYHTKISLKGRTALPVKFRVELGEVVVVTRWYEGSLALFSVNSWEKIQKEILEGANLTRALRGTERFLFGGAYEVELDSQGRFVVPPRLREHAGFGGEVVFVGLRNRVELFDKNRWDKLEKKFTKVASELIEKVQDEKAISRA